MYQSFSLILILLLLSDCGNQPQQSIKFGVSPGPQATIMYAVKNAAQASGLDIQVMEYGNYQALNPALQTVLKPKLT